VVFDHGELLAEGPAAEVMQRPEVMRAYLGQAVDEEAGRA
jgi:branched-chain amino acid transport system permease protein